MDIQQAGGEILTEVNSGLKIYEYTGGLNHGMDAVLLAAYVKPTGGAAAEFGGGGGIVSLLCAARGKFGSVHSVEIQREYHLLAERNAALNGLGHIVLPVHADLRDFNPGVPLDAVFANPPYLKAGGGRPGADEGRFAARHEVYGGIADFTGAAARLLRHGGSFYAVYRPERLADLVCAMRVSGVEPKRMTFVHEDRLRAPCLVLVEGRKGANPHIKATPPLILKEDGLPTPDYEYIYKNGEFDGRFL